VIAWLFWTSATDGASNSPDAAGAVLIVAVGGVPAVVGAALHIGAL
jgi:hypothetical protein